MKKTIKRTLGLSLLLSAVSGLIPTAQTLAHIRDPFFDSWVSLENIISEMSLAHQQASSYFSGNYGMDEETKKAVAQAHKALSKIKPKITEDEQHVIITFKLGKPGTVDKNNISVGLSEDNNKILQGTIPGAVGKVEFTLHNRFLDIVNYVEIKKQDQADKKQAQASYISQTSKRKALPASVDVEHAKATTKDNTLTLVLPKKQQAKITIEHQ